MRRDGPGGAQSARRFRLRGLRRFAYPVSRRRAASISGIGRIGEHGCFMHHAHRVLDGDDSDRSRDARGPLELCWASYAK
jgi:hypothetical protein